MKLGAWLKVGNLIKVNSDLGLWKLFRKVAEEVLLWNIFLKFNTNTKLVPKWCHFMFTSVITTLTYISTNIEPTHIEEAVECLNSFISMLMIQMLLWLLFVNDQVKFRTGWNGLPVKNQRMRKGVCTCVRGWGRSLQHSTMKWREMDVGRENTDVRWVGFHPLKGSIT